MRSRRSALILLVVVILLTGAISAANRDRRSSDRTSTSTTATAPAAAAASSGGSATEVVAKLPSAKPVRAQTGDTVVLRVSSETPDIAKILQVGASTSVGPGLAGELRFVAPTAGDLQVNLEVAGTTAGIVRVTDPQD